MNTKRFNLRMVAAIVACLAVTTMFASCGKTNGDDGGDNANGTFKLKIWQGFDIPNKRVIDYEDNPDSVDLQFFFQWRTTEFFRQLYVYLGALKICEFDNPPTDLTAAQIDGWEDWTVDPAPGKYYVIRARDGRHYLFHLLKYANQGKAHAYWEMTFEWKEFPLK